MLIRRCIVPVIGVLSLLSGATGCATYSTISNADKGSAKVFSGTRLDARALAGETTINGKFNVSAPRYTFLALPFSAMADMVLFPMTWSAAVYEVIFE